MTTSDSFVIDTHDLSKTYKTVQALKSLNLMVPQHAIFGFLGPNGAGKTTTIKLLLGLSRPTSGRATLFGQDIIRDSIAIRQRVGYLPQEPRFYEYMTARETLRFTARLFYAGPKAQIEERVAEILDMVDLADKADRPIKNFSAGERQRLGIAQAQINYPDLLILDEPAASLDPMGRRKVLDVMERLREHTTIFYSTHILDDVQRVSDYVAILNNGELVADATIDELLAGQEGAVYTLTTRGDTGPTLSQLSAQSWVSNVELIPHNGQAQWHVWVNNEEIAEEQLLRQFLADEQMVVTEFGRKKYNLEEVFMSIVAGDDNAEQ
jgi:ABC-2 type transport system ATP-binding protein